MSESGEYEKLLIKAYDQPDYSGKEVSTFIAYVNPHEITIAYDMEYDSAQGAGTTGSRMEFKKVKPGDLTLEFYVDGTGANGKKINVQEHVDKFQSVTGYNGDIHRPNYLQVLWGTMPVKRCVLKSASIAYKLFKSDGSPLRAVISANFTDNSDDVTRVALAQDQSPDLTHIHTVKAGDSLPLLCQKIYGSPNYYLGVAQANSLDNFRELKPGDKIYFPPLEK